MKNISNKQIWLFITCITFFATYLYIDFIFTKNNYLNEKIKDLESRYNLHILQQKTISDLLVDDVINNSKMEELLFKNMNNPINEENYRLQLYNLFSNKFEYLKSKGFNILHFHDNNGKSFIRFHKPKKYGDDLVDFRPSISKVITEQKTIYGIESGIFIQEFRSIYPIFYEKKYVGSAELSSSLSHLINELNYNSLIMYTLLTKKDIVNQTFKKNSKEEYAITEYENYYINKELRKNNFSDESLKELGFSLSHKLDTNKSFSISSSNLSFESNIYTFLPIKNIDDKFVGYLISKEKSDAINQLFLAEFLKFIFLSLLLFVVIKVYIHLQKRNNENRKIFNQYQNIIDKSVIVSKTNPQGIITYVNHQFCKVSGYSKEELIGNSHNIVRHPDSTIPFFRQMWKTLLAKRTWQGVIKNRSKSGDNYYVHSTISPILNEKDEIVEFIALREDITNLVNKKNEFKSEKERMDSLFNYIDEILIIKKDDKFEQISQKFFNLFPFKNLQEFNHQHKCICDLFIPKEGYLQSSLDSDWIRNVLNTPTKINKALLKDREGRIRTFWIRIQKIPYENTYYYLFILNDITSLGNINENKLLIDKQEILLEKTLEDSIDLFSKTKEALKLPEEIIFSLIDKFTQSSDEGLIKLKNSIENNQLDQGKMIAHNIKGSAATLRFEEISLCAQEIESNIEDNPNEQLNNIEKIKHLLENIKRYRRKE
jgi:PAS domain S-box-containing protein